VFAGIVKTGHEQDHVITSATWATDEDISRFLRLCVTSIIFSLKIRKM